MMGIGHPVTSCALFVFGESDQQHPPPIIDNQLETGSLVHLELVLTCADDRAF
jgi:hypothetical protein